MQHLLFGNPLAQRPAYQGSGKKTRQGIKAKDLAAQVGISETQLSLFRSGKVRGIRFRTLAKLCAVLECQPGELLAYQFEAGDLVQADEAGPGQISAATGDR